MKSDALFFFGVLAFFFVLWFATGGPTRPISFAGPYITPLTDVNTEQYGYGSIDAEGNISAGEPQSTQSIWSQIMGFENQVRNLERQAADLRAFGEASPLRGSVTVSAGNVSSEDPDTEYITINVVGTAPVDITGWRLVSGASGDSTRIPSGASLPRSGRINDTGRIVLNPGEQAVVVTGESPLGVSFKENMCTGYLAHRQDYTPALSQQCPAASIEFDRYFTGNTLRDDACYYRMQATPICTPPDDEGLSSRCRDLIDEHLTYNGCVATHQHSTYFPGRTWRIYLEKRSEMWKSTRDAIKLLDAQGKTVDLYTY